ncbi:MAG TPA: hypothetical protein VM934_13005 [Pyrinomonadaceae bacterium]|jgi:hypothetical protein|nr:hypothetical protein [Pyrinomonadaceae bacterium]
MLKKVIFVMCALSVLCAINCGASPEGGNYGRGNLNQPAPNANSVEGIAGNTNAGTSYPDRDKKSVQVAVQAIKGAIQIAVAPELIQVPKNGKLRFSTANNLDQDIVKIELVFASGGPFDGALQIDGVKAGDQVESKVRGVRPDAKEGSYKYTIRVFVKGVSEPIVLDPQVEIVGARMSSSNSNDN